MSVREIILDKAKDRLFEVLHGIPLRTKITESIPYFGDKRRLHGYGDVTSIPNVCKHIKKPPLKEWDVNYITDIINLTLDGHDKKIRCIINSAITKKISPTQQVLSIGELNDTLIDQIVDKIIPLTLILDNHQRAHYYGKNAPTQRPIFPFNIRSLLQMCWGLTLNISSESVEQTLGGFFNTQFGDQFKQIVSARLGTNIDDTNNIFLMNLQMSMSATIRNLGLIRQAHTEYLTLNGERLSAHRQNLEQVADFSSFSGSGLFAKLGSFVGFGSITELYAVQGMKDNFSNVPLVWIPAFIIGGIVGAYVVTIVTRIYVDRTNDSWDMKVKQEQNRYWKEHYKRDVTNEIYNFYVSIVGLIDKFYPPQERNEIMYSDEMLCNPDTERIKAVINEDILAPNELQWFPVVVTQPSQPSSQSGSSQASPSSAPSSKPTNQNKQNDGSGKQK